MGQTSHRSTVTVSRSPQPAAHSTWTTSSNVIPILHVQKSANATSSNHAVTRAE